MSEENQSKVTSSKLNKYIQIGAIVSALFASACCWLPLLLIGFGVSGVAFASFFEQYRILLMVITFVLLGTAFYFTYRPVKKVMVTGENCEVDEAVFGGKVSGKRGRGALNKKKVCIVIEKAKNGGISRAYANKVADFSSKELRKTFDLHIDKSTNIIDTDKWKGYKPISKEWNIIQTKSIPGINFNLMHRFIQQLKGWLRGIHHHASDKYLQGYLDEYCYRFNRHGFKDTIFENLLARMVAHKPVNYKLLV